MMRCPSRNTRRPLAKRHGSAIILCMVAIAVISVASITVVRSHRRLNFRRSATQARSHGRLIADGLVHREIAYNRQSPSSGPAPSNPELETMPGFEKARASVSDYDKAGETMTVDVLLYPGAPVATTRRQVDISKN